MTETKRISIFPLAGALLFPGMHLPLHIFEERYRALINDAMARDRQIGMIQPKTDGDIPELFDIGCVGKIVDIEAMDDGRFNIVLEGVSRFRMIEELDASTAFRQIRAEIEENAELDEVLASAERAALEIESRKFADLQGYQVDWDSIGRLDDMSFVNGIAQIAPFDAASKQALLEIDGLSNRAELIIQLLEFFGRQDGDEGRVTLQ
ncbi:LON peptidase substrate-binding domain-containing protein [Parasphingorhabdus cellanae]|uniref:LON peptidase substrate-binding domain-containing protein n=1 Tax=Parasphingorhabdus cellanae TaxID=2806553 RepID=A0ABX7TA43_9SPHN|nr:LON peptidase substrate-binding domain-containing protein [Parasphingorhabdus cellanae]QTD57494.1 LON peptidase substrate-binding domain-containing protein [Parasphingorhabdus cellanae]